MSVADKITQLVNDISSSYQKIQSKGGTIPTNKNTNNLPNAIDSIPSGGGLAYDMGEFVLDADTVYAKAVPHDLGSKPEFILVWTDDLAGTTNEYGNITNVGFIWMKNLTGLKQRLTASANTTGYTVNYYQGNELNVLSTSAPTSAAYCHDSANDTDTTFVLHKQASNVYWRAGITYKYFVAKAWWNTGLGGNTNA